MIGALKTKQAFETLKYIVLSQPALRLGGSRMVLVFGTPFKI